MKSTGLAQFEFGWWLNVSASPEALDGSSRFSYTKLHAYRNPAEPDGPCNNDTSAEASQLGVSLISSNALDDAPWVGNLNVSQSLCSFCRDLCIELVWALGALHLQSLIGTLFTTIMSVKCQGGVAPQKFQYINTTFDSDLTPN